jgi:hypothetical protein
MTERATNRLRPLIRITIQKQVLEAETILSVAHAWTGFHPIKAKAASQSSRAHELFTRRVVVVTSKLRLILLKQSDSPVRPGSEVVVESAPSELSVESVRVLKDVEKVIISGKIRQLIGLWWEQEDPEMQSQLEIFIFESSTRRRRFRENLQRTAAKTFHGFPGVPEVPVNGSFMYDMQETCKKERLETVISVSFIKPIDEPVNVASIEVLILTLDAMAFVTLASWLRSFAKHADYSMDVEDIPYEDVEDSASDEDRPPDEEDPRVADSVEKLEYSRIPGLPWEVKTIKGVWFMADSFPKAGLVIGNKSAKEELMFFSDGEKQRWR